MLNLNNLEKSIKALKQAIETAKKLRNSSDYGLQETIKAGVIQCFEVAYEQSWKMLQRWIKVNKTPEDAENPRTRKDLFRLAAKYNLISDPVPWFRYGELRNITSHTYDEDKSLEVFNAAEDFLKDGSFLFSRLEEYND